VWSKRNIIAPYRARTCSAARKTRRTSAAAVAAYNAPPRIFAACSMRRRVSSRASWQRACRICARRIAPRLETAARQTAFGISRGMLRADAAAPLSGDSAISERKIENISANYQ
jgi:hypothetical protein